MTRAKSRPVLFWKCCMNSKATFSFFAPPDATVEADDLRHWNKFRRGDAASFTIIYYHHIDALYHYGERLTADKALIEDCLQDLFAELWTRQMDLPEVQTVKFYLFKALKRKINRGRDQQAKFLSEAAAEHDFALTLASETEGDDWQLSPGQAAALLKAVNQLSPRQKEAITLRFYDNFSYNEIAEIMALSDRSVYNLMYRALAVLRQTVDVGTCQQVLLVLLLVQ